MVARKKTKKRVSKKRTSQAGKIPVLVKLISLLFYIIAFVILITGIIFFIGGIVGDSFAKVIDLESVLSTEGFEGDYSLLIAIIQSSLILGGLVLIILSVVDYFIARGLWKGRNWARIVVIIFAVIGFIGALSSLDVFSMLLTGVVGGYLWFNKEARAAFSK